MMSTLVNPNSSTPSSLVREGKAYYDHHLKTELEAHHSGEFVAIDPSSARYFLGRTATAALLAAHSAMPESQFFLTRVGKSTAHKIGGHGAGIR